MSDWTFGRKLAAGFAAAVVLVIIMAGVAIQALRSVATDKDRVIDVNAALLVDAEVMHAARQQKSSAIRAYLLTREERYLGQAREARGSFLEALERLKRAVFSEAARSDIAEVERAEREHEGGVENVIALRRTEAQTEAVGRAFEDLDPVQNRLDAALRSYVARERRALEEAKQQSTDAAVRAQRTLAALAVVTVLLAAAIGFFLARSLSRQIGNSVSQIQSSSAELQAAANQQATATREQVTAMTEIGTTISELLATSRQIAESAQRVAQIAEQTAGAANSGGAIMQTAHESITGIRRQVDLIVNHMLELGKKSQQIGAVLDIVAELAEQTNILAINATIEAAGAGETGKRFAVVADEIRKLADRVADSTKQIRSLIEDMRGSVNTTVMAIESGSKAVDSGTRQFSEVATAFGQITELVGATTEASREIGLSTKQQASAVEQVNVAIVDATQATKETEASSSQTLQTAVELSKLSRDLLRLVEPQAQLHAHARAAHPAKAAAA
jgi:methyl-accepting chemotaxis protein